MTKASVTVNGHDLLISADSHVLEPPDLWEARLPKAFQGRAPTVFFNEQRQSWMFGSSECPPQAVGGFIVAGRNPKEVPNLDKAGLSQARPGGWDPAERLKDMAVDGVSAEVLYPTLGLNLFSIEDAALQEACFTAYNDWLIEFCGQAPHQLVGVGMASLYNVEHAIAEAQRCKKHGLRGLIVWQVPPQRLPFTSGHYDRFWAAAGDLDLPVSFHILTGFGPSRVFSDYKGLPRYRFVVNEKLEEVTAALFDIVFSGALEQAPRLKVVLVENEIGWLPFWLQVADKYFDRLSSFDPLPIKVRPSEAFRRQVFATFFDDKVGGRMLSWWGVDNCMWSNDYPHLNSTWPNSKNVIKRDLGHLPESERRKLTHGNVSQLYSMALSRLSVA